MSLLPGVYIAQKKNGTTYFRSSITYHNKHISLGSFETEETAHKVYLAAQTLLSSQELSIENYKTSSVIPFEKWVILINFRDNQIYIKTPIYLRKSYFEYYLDYKTVLKFAVDDLFYYSNHKIMKRGGHLFVADFGMQVNILSRYGIKNYAVAGKDYIFVNGDHLDYRYENIQIINKYHGVSKISNVPANKNLKKNYVSCIHIHGDYIIGRYSTEVEAAVAYNKAADLLQRKGLIKNFPVNYISELSSEEYQELYKKVPISKKILHFECAD